MTDHNYEIIKSVFTAIVSAVVIWVASSISGELKTMSRSVTDLNAQLAVLVERVSAHNKKVEEHEERLRQLERRR